MDTKCEHHSFAANVEVHRIQKTDDGPVVAFSANVTVRCENCNTYFRWLGVPAGMSAAGPMTSATGLELRAPIAPLDEETDTNLMGFTIRMQGAH